MANYISPNCGQEVKPAQYLAELMVTRQAQRLNVDLPFKFWNTERWKKPFKTELFKAYALLKLYDAQVIINVMNDQKWLSTLLYRDLQSLLDKEVERLAYLQKLAEVSEEIEETNVNEAQPKFVSKTGKLRKLRDLDA